METVIFFSNNGQDFSYRIILDQLSNVNRSKAIQLLKKTISKDFQMELKPWKKQVLDSKEVYLFLISADNKSLVGLSIDDFLEKIKNFGLKLFTQEMIKDLDIKFESLSSVQFQLIIPINSEYIKTIKTGHRNQGDEHDGPFNYNYFEKLFPTISSDNEKYEMPIVIDECYVDKHYHNRIKENQNFLFYLEVEDCLDSSDHVSIKN